MFNSCHQFGIRFIAYSQYSCTINMLTVRKNSSIVGDTILQFACQKSKPQESSQCSVKTDVYVKKDY